MTTMKLDNPIEVITGRVRMAKWNELEKGNIILFSNLPIRVTQPPMSRDDVVGAIQWEDIELEVGPWRNYYMLIDDHFLKTRLLCRSCFSTEVYNPDDICDDCKATESDTEWVG